MASQLSGIAIILFIAFGSLTIIVLFIFAKRQITRFALKNKYGPHIPIAMDAPKKLRLEIERRLDSINRIQSEPQLLSNDVSELFNDEEFSQLTPLHLYRMKVVDHVRELSNMISKNKSFVTRYHEDTIQYFLCLHKDGAMPNVDLQVLYKFLIIYENARHQPNEFGYEEYMHFVPLLKIVQNDILKCSSYPSNLNNCKSKFKTRVDEMLVDESATPLLNQSSTKSNTLIRKLAHETSV